MSSFEAGSVVPDRAGTIRRWFFVSVAVGVLLVAALAIVAEPWFVFRRIDRASSESDFDVLHALVEPGVPLDQLQRALVFAQQVEDRGPRPRYVDVNHFEMVARPGLPFGPAEIAFVLERRGLSWKLAAIRPQDALLANPGEELHVEPLSAPAFGRPSP